MENKFIHKPKGGRKDWDSPAGQENRPLEFIDGGCQVHEPSKVIIKAAEAGTIIGEIIRNLQKEGEFPTYICNQGHTHRLKLKGKGSQVGSGKRQADFKKLGRRAGI